MNAQEFIGKWRQVELRERQACRHALQPPQRRAELPEGGFNAASLMVCDTSRRAFPGLRAGMRCCVALLAIEGAAIGGVAGGPAVAPGHSAPQPSREAAFPLFGTVKSGMWLDGGRVLLIHTIIPHRLAKVLPDGRVESAMTFPTAEHPGFSPSFGVSRGPGETLWMSGAFGILRLDQALRGGGLLDLKKLALAGCERFGGLLQPQVVPSGVIALVACQQSRTANYAFFGYARLQLAPEPVLTRLRPLAELTNAGGLAWMVPTLAQVRGEVFALVFEGGPHLERVYPRKGVLRAFPEEFAEVPDLARNERNPQPVFYRNVEAASMAAGLYGQGKHLFLLTRRHAGRGSTSWAIHRIDPMTDTLEATIPLPTQAPHLIVVPGPSEWAFVEQGSWIGMDGKSTRRILFVPAQEFERPGGPAKPASASTYRR